MLIYAMPGKDPYKNFNFGVDVDGAPEPPPPPPPKKESAKPAGTGFNLLRSLRNLFRGTKA